MKIKVDENLPIALSLKLVKMGHDTETVYSEGLNGKEDDFIWNCTQVEKRFLITQDLDFSDIRRFKPGSHFGILLIRLINPSRRKLIEKIVEIFQRENVENWKRCFLVLTENKLRIKRPKSFDAGRNYDFYTL